MKYTIEDTTLTSLGDAVRSVTGSTSAYTPLEMASAIYSIQAEGGNKVALTWNQCPELPRNFVNNVTYDSTDTTTSQIATYAPGTAVTSNCKPIGETIGEKTFYNGVPGVGEEFITGDIFGTVTPLDQLRWINATDAVNVRDLGGWACDGGTVKYGLVFRGGAPTSNDRSVLVEECGIRHDLNLTPYSESPYDESPLGSDIWFTRTDVINWYTAEINDGWKTNIQCVFDAVAHNEPVYLHCTAGADRTATIICVLEGLLGMSRSDIDKDYELSCFYTGTSSDTLARRRNEAEWQQLLTQIASFGGDSFRDQCVSFVIALGFTVDDINQYRQAMIDGSPESVSGGYTNLLALAVGNDGEILRDSSGNSLGYADGYYLSGNATVACQNVSYAATDSTHFITGFIPYTVTQAEASTPIYIKGVTIDTSQSHTRMCAYNSYDASTYIDPIKFSAGSSYIGMTELDTGYYKVIPTTNFISTMAKSTAGTDFQYVRFSLSGSGAGVIITVGETIA